jgi:RNA polymerase sigma factor (sigma-70 family)
LGLSSDGLAAIQNAVLPPLSLSRARLDPERDGAAPEFAVPDPSVDAEFERAEMVDAVATVRRAMRLLTRGERNVLRRRYSDQEPTLREIGKELGVTGERVRQLEAAGLRKLRGSRKLRQLAA